MSSFPALPGFYQLLFLHIEPISTISPAFLGWFFPGAAWFYRGLVPEVVGVRETLTTVTESTLDVRARMAVWQLTNCYLLLGLISSLVFRAVRDALPHDPVAQERIVGASLLALALADVTHMIATFVGLPAEIRFSPGTWNSLTHGSISFVIVLLSSRLAWFAGIGRKRYYYGQPISSKKAN